MTENTRTSPDTAIGIGNTKAVLNSVEEAVAAMASGELIIVVDDADRENEGDLIMAAELATPEQVAFMIRNTSGILCVPLTLEDARRLQLTPMVSDNNAPLRTAFTVSVDYRIGVTTGISAEERTNTIRAIANHNVPSTDFVKPGHVFSARCEGRGRADPFWSHRGGRRSGTVAGLRPIGVLAEIVNDDGTVMRLSDCCNSPRSTV